MEPINYVPYEQGGSFTPVTPASRTRALQEEQQRQAQGLQTYFSLQDVNSARRAEERKANNYGENFKQLGAFSKTLVDLGVKIEKQSIEDRLTGEFVDGIINPQEIQAENAVIQQGTAQVEAGKATAEAITATTGNTTTAAIAQSKVLKGYGAGLQNERALLVSARSQMAGFYQNYLATSDDKVLINGQDTGWTVKQAAKSTDPVVVQAAMMKARSEFIKEFGLWQTTKRNFAEIVAPTLLQTEGYTSQGIISRNIQIEQDNSKKQIESNAYSEGRLLVTEPKREVILNKFHNLVYEAYNSTAGLTVEQAREVVAQEVIKGLIDARDTQGLAALGATPYDLRQGPDGKRIDQRTLGDVFAKDFLKARQQIDELIKKDLEEKQEEARQAAYRELAELPDNAPREQRIAVIRATQDRLEALGDYEGSIALGEKAAQLSTASDSKVNEEAIKTWMAKGGKPTAAMIDQWQAEGRISTSFADELKKQNIVDWSKDPAIRRIVESRQRGFKARFLEVNGYRQDPVTGKLLPGNRPLINSQQLERILNAHEEDLWKSVDILLNGADPGNSNQVQADLVRGLDNMENESIKPGGKYYLLPPGQTVNSLDPGTPEYNQAKQRAQSLSGANALLGPPDVRVPGPKDWTIYGYRPGQQPTTELRANFRPGRGDKLVEQTYVLGWAQQWRSGVVSPTLKSTAASFGMTPLELLNSQLKAWQQPIIAPSFK